MRGAPTLPRILRSLWRLDPTGTKEMLRRMAIGIVRLALRVTSQTYLMHDGLVVVVAPHQDDETLGAGALIARRRNEGLPVHVVFITDGSASHPGHPEFAPAAISAMRRREARTALSILGVESHAVHFLDEPDGTLATITAARRCALVRRLAEILRTLQPAELFMPCNPDGSTEHDASFDFVIEAVRESALRPRIWQFPVWLWWNPTLLLERVVFSRRHCAVPTEDFAPIKSQAVARYRSQVEPLAPQREPALPPELVRNFNTGAEYFFHVTLPEAKPLAARKPSPLIV